MPTLLKKVRPDAKGRIYLGASLTDGVSSYTVTEEGGRIILEPNVEISANEKWHWESKIASGHGMNGTEVPVAQEQILEAVE